MKTQRLMRVWYKTDVFPDEPEFSDPFPAETASRRVVDVDWSNPGEVRVTWLVTP